MTPEYRYTLERCLSPMPFFPQRRIMFCALNPSTATADKDDPTVRRMIGFAWRFAATEMRLVNLYAARSTDPSNLWRFYDPVGPLNDDHICQEAFEADVVIAAWGANLRAQERARRVLSLMRRYGHVYRLGDPTRAGCPRHPLYLPAELDLQVHATEKSRSTKTSADPP